uniref:Protein kinase domain-containing protein n=1 Tax=Oryza meridionalis TaxID=40149 RepID=A0A0E0EQ69_9ORYZ
MLMNGEEVAVKKIHNCIGIDENQFWTEFENLTRLKHRNIVRLVSFCNETQEVVVEVNGNDIVALEPCRALCLEYMPNGNLSKYISDEHDGLDWYMRYKIIKGICEGLKYLHEETEKPVYHFDLKPENILLDKDMVPKLADFGLSGLLDRTGLATVPIGSRGYLPPEYVYGGLVSRKFDTFSLGVIIIHMVAGDTEFSPSQFTDEESSAEAFANNIRENWRKRPQKKWGCTSLEVDCNQVKTCIKIATKCVNSDRSKRPSVGDIVRQLKETEVMDQKENSESDELLSIEPLELQFPIIPKEAAPACSLQLTNWTHDYVAYLLTYTGPKKFFRKPAKGVLPPRSTVGVTVTMQEPAQEDSSSQQTSQLRDSSSSIIVRSTRVSEDVDPSQITRALFVRKVAPAAGGILSFLRTTTPEVSRVVNKVIVKVVHHVPPPATTQQQPEEERSGTDVHRQQPDKEKCSQEESSDTDVHQQHPDKDKKEKEKRSEKERSRTDDDGHEPVKNRNKTPWIDPPNIWGQGRSKFNGPRNRVGPTQHTCFPKSQIVKANRLSIGGGNEKGEQHRSNATAEPRPQRERWR